MSSPITSISDFDPSHYTLLIVDDNPTNLRVIFDYLRHYGFQIVVARDGESGFKRAQYVRPDLILLDVMLPDIDGFEVCYRLKNYAMTRDIPVIFMTALVDIDDKVKGFQCGAVDYVTKPLQEAEVLARVSTHLQLQQVTTDLRQANAVLTKRALQLEISSEVAQQVTSMLDLDALLKTVAQLIQSRFGYAFVGIWLVTEQHDAVVLRAGTGQSHIHAPSPGYRIPLGVSTSNIGRMYQTGQAYLDEAVPVELYPRPEETVEETRTELSVPLRIGSTIIGGLTIQLDRAGAFDAHDQSVMQLLADQIAIAIRNARLYETSEKRASQLAELNASLEERVADRTVELSQANAVLIEQIHERQRVEAALRQAEAKYHNIVENAIEGIFQSTPAGRFLSVNRAFAQLCGYASPEEMIISITDIQHQLYVDPQDREELLRLLAEHGNASGFETQFYRKDGSKVWVSGSVRIVYNEHHQPLYYEGIVEDITERKRLQAQFFQSQKMESVGRLAGGIAHDFNNLLTVITGNTSLALSALPPDDPLSNDLNDIQDAAQRAATLTRRLLAFARKQRLEPRVLNLNTLILDLDALLRRLIRADIEFAVYPAPDLWAVKVDPNQIEQVLINLVVNASDAMPKGGKLTVETTNMLFDTPAAHIDSGLKPGPYVMLMVSDTGIGIAPEIQARMFEPFFTTKATGQGSGLGLATCYGIIKQHGGDILVSSVVGHGSTFKVYLPRSDEQLAAPTLQSTPTLHRGSETVLLVEDETGVRQLAARVLRKLGYTVLEASNGSEGLQRACEYSGTIELLVADVVMPQMGGETLAAQLAVIRPNMQVLFISGYPANVVFQHSTLSSGSPFLQKPFTPEALASKVRMVLDQADSQA